MSVVRQRTNERRIPGRGPLGPLRPLRPLGHLGALPPLGPALTAACALLTACAVLAGCTAGPGQPAFKPGGPPITLQIGVYGDPGYQRSGLYAEYERLHPNVRIVQTGRAPQAAYWQALQGALKSGRGLDDIQAVPVADIAAVTSSLAGDFVPLNTLGGVSGGTSAFADDWLPWVARQAANRAGTTYALGAEIGPIATCYRTSLLAEAGLPTRPAVLARDWSTWSGYLRSGRLFRSRIPHGPAFTDSAASLYSAMAAQAPEQYYSPAGRLAVRGNPAIKAAWDTAVQASRGGLTAGLAPQTTAWDRGVARSGFATVMCPAWMLHQIAALGGPPGSGGWNVTAAPGGAGNSGGFYLALPKAGRHQQAAFQLASFLTGEQAGVRLFRADGDFPANFAAATAVTSVTSGYFSEARVGRIFSQAADRTPDAPAGPASGAIAAIVDGQLAQVEAGRRSAGSAWRAVLRQASAAGTSTASPPRAEQPATPPSAQPG
jgi:cellobiose transport system substrate-binding protein